MDCCGGVKYIRQGSINYTVSVLFSMILLGVSIAGLCGAFHFGDNCYWTSMLSLIAGLYMKLPSIKEDKKDDTLVEDIRQ